MNYGLLVVEGPHDAEFAARLLHVRAFKRISMLTDLLQQYPLWKNLVPTRFPHDDDLLKRMPVPVFFGNSTHSIAVLSAGGDSRIPNAVQDSLDVLEEPDPGDRVVGVGLLIDADMDKTKSALMRFEKLKRLLDGKRLRFGLAFPASPGIVSHGMLRAGIFVLPDNNSAGTLEVLLLRCADDVYPEVKTAAQSYLQNAKQVKDLNEKDLKELNKPAGFDKATVACIASVLKPGKAVQTSLQDNRWLDEPLTRLPDVAAVQRFLFDVFDL